MRSIYKYELPVKEKHTIHLPVGAQIIRVEDVDGKLFLWAVVNTDHEQPKEPRYLEFYKTGQEMPDYQIFYLGACKLHVGQELCLYCFENTSPSYTPCNTETPQN